MTKLEEYNPIDFVYYIKMIKKYRVSLAAIIIAVTLATVLFIIWGPAAAQHYTGKTSLVIGIVEKEPIQSAEEVIDALALYDSELEIKKGGGTRLITISANGSSSKEVSLRLKNAADLIRKEHEKIFAEKTASIDKHIASLAKKIEKNDASIKQFETMTNRLSPYDGAQVLALQTYLDLYMSALDRKDTFENSIQELEQQKLAYEKTKIQASPLESEAPIEEKTTLFAALIAGPLLGIIIGIFWIFIREWWIINKRRSALS